MFRNVVQRYGLLQLALRNLNRNNTRKYFHQGLLTYLILGLLLSRAAWFKSGIFRQSESTRTSSWHPDIIGQSQPHTQLKDRHQFVWVVWNGVVEAKGVWVGACHAGAANVIPAAKAGKVIISRHISYDHSRGINVDRFYLPTAPPFRPNTSWKILTSSICVAISNRFHARLTLTRLSKR